jgi:HEAT repeat protein
MLWGNSGGEDACAFLTKLLEDESAFNDLVVGQVSKDDLRVAIVKSLGAIGDARAINSVRTYRENLSTTQKIFFKNSPVQKTISDILHDK